MVGEVLPEDGQTAGRGCSTLNGAPSTIELVSDGPPIPPLLFAEAYEPGVCEALAAALGGTR